MLSGEPAHVTASFEFNDLSIQTRPLQFVQNLDCLAAACNQLSESSTILLLAGNARKGSKLGAQTVTEPVPFWWKRAKYDDDTEKRQRGTHAAFNQTDSDWNTGDRLYIFEHPDIFHFRRMMLKLFQAGCSF